MNDLDSVKNIRGVDPEPARTGPGVPGVKHKLVPRGDVVRPGQYRNGENREGTPAGMESTAARKMHNMSPAVREHKRRERGDK